MLDVAPMSATDESLLLHNCHVTNELALNQLTLKKHPLLITKLGTFDFKTYMFLQRMNYSFLFLQLPFHK